MSSSTGCAAKSTNTLEEFLSPGDNIFELNAGTGIDAVYFAEKGHSVFAIDNAEGMLIELEKKIESFHLQEKIQFDAVPLQNCRRFPNTALTMSFQISGD